MATDGHCPKCNYPNYDYFPSGKDKVVCICQHCNHEWELPRG